MKEGRLSVMKYEKENIVDLIKLLEDMYSIVVKNSNNDINYGKRTMHSMIDYLKAELTDSEPTEYKELIIFMREKYNSMFPPKGGLSDFHIWHSEYEKRRKKNSEYEQTKTQIERILEIK